jgi:hypothetical protein
MRRAIPLLLYCLALAPAKLPNSNPDLGSIEGQITDDLGRPMADVQIRVRNVMTGTIVRTSSDLTGEYVVADLPSGRYSLWANARGQGSIWIREILVSPGEHVRRDIRFESHVPTRNACRLFECA